MRAAQQEPDFFLSQSRAYQTWRTAAKTPITWSFLKRLTNYRSFTEIPPRLNFYFRDRWKFSGGNLITLIYFYGKIKLLFFSCFIQLSNYKH